MISPVQLHMSPSLAHQNVPGTAFEGWKLPCETGRFTICSRKLNGCHGCQHHHPFPLHRSLEIQATYNINRATLSYAISCQRIPNFTHTKYYMICSPGHTAICSVKKTGTLWFGIAPALYPPQVLLNPKQVSLTQADRHVVLRTPAYLSQKESRGVFFASLGKNVMPTKNLS